MLLQADQIRAGYGRLRVLWLALDRGRLAPVCSFIPTGYAGRINVTLHVFRSQQRAGRILYSGSDISGKKPQAIVEAGLVHVPQGSTLLPRMSVLEALTLGAYTRRAWARRHTTVEQVFALFPVPPDAATEALQHIERRRKANGGDRRGAHGSSCFAHA